VPATFYLQTARRPCDSASAPNRQIPHRLLQIVNAMFWTSEGLHDLGLALRTDIIPDCYSQSAEKYSLYF